MGIGESKPKSVSGPSKVGLLGVLSYEALFEVESRSRAVRRESMYRLNRVGDSTDPWGTPIVDV